MKLKRLSIGTFNLYNLNEPGLPIYTDESGWSQEEYDLKIDLHRPDDPPPAPGHLRVSRTLAWSIHDVGPRGHRQG